ncbi:MAG: AraC family transcriptional regulator [Spirosomataceae bacterium]
MAILSILDTLTQSQDYVYLHTETPKNQYNRKEQARLKKVYAFIDTHYQRKIDINEAAELTHLSHAASCRYFKKMTKLTLPKLKSLMHQSAKRLLMLDRNVTETCYACGFESLSLF